MGSRGRNSSSASSARSIKARNTASKPPSQSTCAARFKEAANDVVGQLDDAWSVFSVALKALDNIHETGERRLDAPVTCLPDDVATVLRCGLASLEGARAALQTRVVEGQP